MKDYINLTAFYYAINKKTYAKMYCQIGSKNWLVIFGTLVAVLLRCSVTLHSHSGQNTPPMYGDYEAQRHWMEITLNLPLNQWYHNASDNDLNYWGLDYPPLTAYHMFLCGKVGDFINPNFTKLHESRGYETAGHKLFMRYTVLLGDIAIFLPAIILYFYTCVNLEDYKTKKKPKELLGLKIMDTSLSIVLSLLYPGIILIDHGHFQYNTISLGFFVLATVALLCRLNILASIMFCLALNYKQMELYHALPFFLYLLSTCVPKPGQNAISGILKLAKIGITVIITFGVIWFPFMFNLDDFLQVLHRQFPVARGVFEDKVSNIWCVLNIFFKFKNRFDNFQMMRICLFTTITAILPSSADLFLRPNLKKFVLATINSSLAFFLFSFQVHEKSILLVAIPVLLYFPYAPFACFWFLFISVFSMTPLLIKDNLVVATISLSIFYVISFRVSVEHAFKSMFLTNEGLLEYYHRILDILFKIERKKNADLYTNVKLTYTKVINNRHALFALIFHFTILVSLFGCVVLFTVALLWEPPKRYPDLYPLLISVYSCVHFLGFFVYFNVKQFQIPQEFEHVRHVKVKSS